jgi:glucose-1-phosphate cytidylyltransferase
MTATGAPQGAADRIFADVSEVMLHAMSGHPIEEGRAMKTIILCGGKGERLREMTEAIPKPMVEIGGRPIIWHVMKIYSHFGLDDFVLCLGYKGDKIKEFFVEYEGWRQQDFILQMGAPAEERIHYPANGQEHWRVTFADTGQETNTGGRIKAVEKYVDDDIFCASYGDDLWDVPVDAVIDFHRRHGRIATLTAVQPVSSYGVLEMNDDGLITRFREKPRLDHWINGGCFVFDRRVFEYLEASDVLEEQPFQRLAADGQIMAYRHRGFWASMNTFKEMQTLNAHWRANGANARWKVWAH